MVMLSKSDTIETGETIHNLPEDGPLSVRQLRIMRNIVLATGVLLVIGFIGLVGVIVYKISHLTQSPVSVQDQQTAQSDFVVPAGASLQNFQIGSDYLALQTKGQTGAEIAIIHIKTGHVVRRIQIKEQK